ncbi:hypothetical protein PG994_005728 [Apiospora phragmitis]|uniref:Uncharacterized protein n=1 Tax=Apiospora phragmitis TaxID=2905665 RepID=A0ABR1VE24_9PEZI
MYCPCISRIRHRPEPEDYKAWWQLYRKKWRGLRTVRKLDENSKPSDLSSPLTAEDFDTIIGHCAAITNLDAAVFALY